MCDANTKYCDAQLLRTCNATGDGYVANATIDCADMGQTCADTPKPAHCADVSTTGGSTGTSGGNPSDVLINIDDLIRNAIGGNIPNLTSIGAIITRILPYLYAIAGFALLIFLILGGFSYLTSTGDPKKMEAAKGTITSAIIGFVIIFVAYWLTQLVQFIFKLQTPGGGGIF